jgi:hypothetical protein
MNASFGFRRGLFQPVSVLGNTKCQPRMSTGVVWILRQSLAEKIFSHFMPVLLDQ